MKNFFTLGAATLLLAACASTPPPAPWQANASSALQGYSTAYLSGNTRLADFEFTRAKQELASTARPDLMARAELMRCGTRVASLEFDDCAAYQPLAQDASASEKAYAAFLAGNWTGLDPALLPAHHRVLVTNAQANKPAQATSVLASMEDPLARLVAAGVLLQTGRLSAPDMVIALDTASSQGWRRPLLAWLNVQLKRASEAGDRDAQARIQRRIDLVAPPPDKNQ
ncbi:MAG: hypothetical protein IPH54_10510 [Rhodoferax sp.]|nr:hypothetical protein [Rhodoferax sp.]